MNTSMGIQSQFAGTKFCVPVAPGPLMARPRLSALLDHSLKRPLSLVSAPAGFGKTTFLQLGDNRCLQAILGSAGCLWTKKIMNHCSSGLLS
jgi:hypothetical protein